MATESNPPQLAERESIESLNEIVTATDDGKLSVRLTAGSVGSPRQPPPPVEFPPGNEAPSNAPTVAAAPDPTAAPAPANAPSAAAAAARPRSITRAATESNLLPRHINILAPTPAIDTTNVIVTSKYTPINFLPFVLYELLHPYNRFANFFYLVVGGLQLVPMITPFVPPTPIAWTNLFVIVCIDLYLLAREDFSRHVADRATNNQRIDVISRDEQGGLSSKRTTWAQVKVGDVVRVMEREAFPADLVLLRGSDPPGQCWVNTKPLDGESDMKLRLAPSHGLSPEPETTSGDEPLEKQLD